MLDKLQKSAMPLILFCFSVTSFGAVDIAQSMVPRGKVIESFGRDHIVKTKAGTKIGIQFRLDGKFEEASGKNLNHGDELEPGEGLLSLGSAAQALQEKGLKPQGHWLLEEDRQLGWIYEFETTVIDAKTGKILKNISPKTSSETADTTR